MKWKIVTAIAVGAVCFALALGFRLIQPDAGDLYQALRPARDLLAGLPQLTQPPSAVYAPSPLTIIPLGLLFAPFQDQLAAALFCGLTAGWLAWLLIREHYWRLIALLGYPFMMCLMLAQVAPLLVALALVGFAPLAVLIKPHIALPLLLSQRTYHAAWLLAGLIGLASLIVFPLWPLTWLEQLAPYHGYIPLLAPLGWVLLLPLFAWRDKLARLLVAMAAVPQHQFYDSFLLSLIPQTRLGLVFTSLMSWPLLATPDWPYFLRVWMFLYLPPLCVLAVERHWLSVVWRRVVLGHDER